MITGSSASIYVREIEDCTDRAGAINCSLGRDIGINYSKLEKYCWAQLRPIDVDLLIVAGACAFADRIITRNRRKSWSRHLAITVPVHDIERWADPAVIESLNCTLNHLTGDEWDLNFYGRKKADMALQLALLTKSFGKCAVLSYSGGLDSFAHLGIELATKADRVPVLMTTEHGDVASVVRATLRGSSVHSIGVPIRPHVGEHAEPTFRTRTFLFLSAASVAWRLSGAEEIVVAEPGPGTLGPSLVPFAEEAYYRGTHPSFTAMFSDFINLLWDSKPTISHPNMWITKAQLLLRAKRLGALAGWNSTVSCSRNVARQKGAEYLQPCGICGGCLYRRVSLAAAGLADSDETYYWGHLGAVSLPRSSHAPQIGRTRTGESDTDVAYASVLGLTHLARAADWDDHHPEFARVVVELADVLKAPEEVISQSVKQLLQQHKAEWEGFLSKLPKTSWLLRLALEG